MNKSRGGESFPTEAGKSKKMYLSSNDLRNLLKVSDNRIGSSSISNIQSHTEHKQRLAHKGIRPRTAQTKRAKGADKIKSHQRERPRTATNIPCDKVFDRSFLTKPNPHQELLKQEKSVELFTKLTLQNRKITRLENQVREFSHEKNQLEHEKSLLAGPVRTESELWNENQELKRSNQLLEKKMAQSRKTILQQEENMNSLRLKIRQLKNYSPATNLSSKVLSNENQKSYSSSFRSDERFGDMMNDRKVLSGTNMMIRQLNKQIGRDDKEKLKLESLNKDLTRINSELKNELTKKHKMINLQNVQIQKQAENQGKYNKALQLLLASSDQAKPHLSSYCGLPLQTHAWEADPTVRPISRGRNENTFRAAFVALAKEHQEMTNKLHELQEDLRVAKLDSSFKKKSSHAVETRSSLMSSDAKGKSSTKRKNSLMQYRAPEFTDSNIKSLFDTLSKTCEVNENGSPDITLEDSFIKFLGILDVLNQIGEDSFCRAKAYKKSIAKVLLNKLRMLLACDQAVLLFSESDFAERNGSNRWILYQDEKEENLLEEENSLCVLANNIIRENECFHKNAEVIDPNIFEVSQNEASEASYEVIAMPLVHQIDVVGVIMALRRKRNVDDNSDKGHFSQFDKHMIQFSASKVAKSVANNIRTEKKSRLNDNVYRESIAFEKLHFDFISQSPVRFIQSTQETICKLLGGECAVLFLVDFHNPEMFWTCSASHKRQLDKKIPLQYGDRFEEEKKLFSLQANGSIAAQVLQSKSPIILENGYRDVRFNGNIDIGKQNSAGSPLICAPVLIQHENAYYPRNMKSAEMRNILGCIEITFRQEMDDDGIDMSFLYSKLQSLNRCLHRTSTSIDSMWQTLSLINKRNIKKIRK